MAIEIERKYLVKNDTYKNEAFNATKIEQGYLCVDPDRTVRVRTKGEKAFLTIKGGGNASGLSRFEWEKEIEYSEAKEILLLCLPGLINKTRYEVRSGDHVIEVDEFYGDNKGLIIAEIELASEDENIQLPAWIGAEVTGDARYYNAQLMLFPYCQWK